MSKPRKRSHGTGGVYRRKGGGEKPWFIRWREGGERKTKSGYADEKAAKQALKEKLAEIETGTAGKPSSERSRMKLSELAKDWLDRRKETHRSAKDDTSRFKVWLTPFFGYLLPKEVTPALIRRFVEHALAKGLSSTTAGHCVRALSTFYTDLIEEKIVTSNPARGISKSTKRLIRNARDPKDTPFLERAEDIRAVFLHLPEPINVAFAVGALAGLRTSEVLGLDWSHVDLDARRIMVRQQAKNGKLGGLKDDESRVVPLGHSLAPVLRAWRLKTGGKGLLFTPTLRANKKARFLDAETLGRHLDKALEGAQLPDITWYQATRHTFASQFVMNGGSIEKLRDILGHCSVLVTERYAHLNPSHFGERELSAVSVDLTKPAGTVVPFGSNLGTNQGEFVDGAPSVDLATG